MRLLTPLFALAFVVVACGDDPDALTGRGQKGPGASGGDGTGDVTPESLQCTDKPQGRSYKNFDGQALESDRTNENIGVNRARVKPYSVMAGEYTRAIGAPPPSLAGAASSFDDPPARWFDEASHSGVSLNALFEISFEGCKTYVAGQADLASAPTGDSASKFCSSFMRKAWSRTPSPEEISGCSSLATDKLSSEPDVKRRWAYVCASVLSSTQFLTF